MKTVILILILIHGIIHLWGFTKTFNLAGVTQFTQDITKAKGLEWLIINFPSKT